jgi:HAD superfamily hydrolase (TIGR01509 family)
MKQNKRIDAVIFDMDGTIFNTEKLGIEKWIQAFEHHNISVPLKVLYNKIGLSDKDSRRLMQEESGIEFDYDVVKKLKLQLTKEHIAKYGTPIKDGFMELMELLKNRRIKTAVATSRRHENTMYYLNHSAKDMAKQFDTIVTGDMIENGKPNPDIFLLASKLLSVLPKHCLVVEDSVNGIKAATAAQMRVIMIPDLIEPSEELKKSIFALKTTLSDVIGIICEVNG